MLPEWSTRYRQSLALCEERGIRRIAFPAISCGIYGYPIKEASAIAVEEVVAFARGQRVLDLVEFSCFSNDVLAAYEQYFESFANLRSHES